MDALDGVCPGQRPHPCRRGPRSSPPRAAVVPGVRLPRPCQLLSTGEDAAVFGEAGGGNDETCVACWARHLARGESRRDRTPRSRRHREATEAASVGPGPSGKSLPDLPTGSPCSTTCCAPGLCTRPHPELSVPSARPTPPSRRPHRWPACLLGQPRPVRPGLNVGAFHSPSDPRLPRSQSFLTSDISGLHTLGCCSCPNVSPGPTSLPFPLLDSKWTSQRGQSGLLVAP